MDVLTNYDHNLWTHFTGFFPPVLLLVTSEPHPRGFIKVHPGRRSSKQNNKEISPESISIIFSLLNSSIGKCSKEAFFFFLLTPGLTTGRLACSREK